MAVVDLPHVIVRVSPHDAPGRTFVAEPITVGVPFPTGFARDADHLRVFDERAAPVAAQASATERWADGSVKWALVDFQATGDVRSREYAIRADAAATKPMPERRVDVSEQANGVRVDTGVARLEFR